MACQAEEEARAGAPTLGALPIVALHMREVTKKVIMRASKLYGTISHAWFVFLNDG